MLKLQKLGNFSLALAISSLTILSVEKPSVALNYECHTGKYYVKTNTNSRGKLVYTAFQETPEETHDYSRDPEKWQRNPSLILYNGKERYTNNGNSSMMTWSTAEGYIYQVSVNNFKGGMEIGKTRGQLIVKRKGKVILRQKCDYWYDEG